MFRVPQPFYHTPPAYVWKTDKTLRKEAEHAGRYSDADAARNESRLQDELKRLRKEKEMAMRLGKDEAAMGDV